MKKLLFLIFIFISNYSFSQQEWGDVEKNNITLKEIAPIWPGCESDNVAQRDACFDKKLIEHIVKNYKYPAKEYNNNIQGKVVVNFFINEEGLVEIKSVTGGNKGLQEEAKRNILAIPKMKPGMLGGKFKAISYTIPITFKTGR
ncbi:MAG: TonB family protein [Flavobacteriales bacterium]